MIDKDKMMVGVQVDGYFLGFESTFYMDSKLNAACCIQLNNESLTKFLDLFNGDAAALLNHYVNKLGKVSSSVLVWIDADGGLTLCLNSNNKENSSFILYTAANAKLLLFDFYKDDKGKLLDVYDEKDAALDKVLQFLDVKELLFCYIKGKPSGDSLEKILDKRGVSIPKIREESTRRNIFLYTKLNTSSLGNLGQVLESAMFGVKSLEFYAAIAQEEIRFYLSLPAIHTFIVDSEDLSLEIKVGDEFEFEMNGIFIFPSLGGCGFQMAAEFALSHVEFSAASLPDQVYKVPGISVTLSNMALSLGIEFSTPIKFEFGLMAEVTIRELMLFGALHFFYPVGSEEVMIDLLAIALTQLSIPAICKNVLGLDNPAIESFDIISIMPFELNGLARLVPEKDITVEQIVDFINKEGISNEFVVSKESISYEIQEGEKCSIRVLDKERMLHYNIETDGKLVLSPQFFYAAETTHIGGYTYNQGIFFCGEVDFLKARIKTIFCAIEGQGTMGFAQISGLDCGIIKLIGSTRSSGTVNPVCTGTDSLILKLAGEKPNNPAVLFVSLSRDKYSFYADGKVKLCEVYELDTQIILMNGVVSIYASYTLDELFTVTVDFGVNYTSILKFEFQFHFVFDAEGLYSQLDSFKEYVVDLANKIKSGCSSAEEQLQIAESQVLSLKNQISDIERAIDECKEKIKRAKWWQVWITVEEGAKILAYEASIAALNISMGVALAALELARAAVAAFGFVSEEILKTINLVISGVMNAFFVHYLELGFEVKPAQGLVDYSVDLKGKVKLTVIGKDIESEFNIGSPNILGKAKSIIEAALTDLVKGAFGEVSSPQDCIEERNVVYDRTKTYGHLMVEYTGPEDLDNMLKLSQEGIDKLERGAQMGMSVSEEYIKEICEERPEFIEMLTSYRHSAANGATQIGRMTEELYAPVRSLAQLISERLAEVRMNNRSDVEVAEIQEALDKYKLYTEPAMERMEEMRNRWEKVALSINPDEGKVLQNEMKAKIMEESDESIGIQIIGNRDYPHLYDRLEGIVERFFPAGEESNFFHLGNEEMFFEALNNSRKESGCDPIDKLAFEEKKRKRDNLKEYKRRL